MICTVDEMEMRGGWWPDLVRLYSYFSSVLREELKYGRVGVEFKRVWLKMIQK